MAAMAAVGAVAAAAEQTVVPRVVSVALKAHELGVQPALLNLQATKLGATVSRKSSRQRCGVQCRGRKAARASDGDESEKAHVCARSTQYALLGKLCNKIKNNFEIPTKTILDFQQPAYKKTDFTPICVIPKSKMMAKDVSTKFQTVDTKKRLFSNLLFYVFFSMRCSS